AMPKIGSWKEWTPDRMEKIIKKRKIEKPNPTITKHTNSSKS
ncbi:7518_t:CDS:1, partial [Cetraspora pellucida]